MTTSVGPVSLADQPYCPCGCGASSRGWSDTGRVHGFRNGVPRVLNTAHGAFGLCGRDLDQYGKCVHSGLDKLGGILTDYGLIPAETAERISHSYSEQGTYVGDR